jgi:hypothetical protein
VSPTQHPVEVAATPSGLELEADVQPGADRPDRVERKRAQVTSLDAGDGRPRDMSGQREVLLPPTLAESRRSNHRPEAEIIHGPMMELGVALALI